MSTTDQLDLFQQWEARLAAEGLGDRGDRVHPWVDGALLGSLAPWNIGNATAPLKYTSPDYQEVLALDELLYWLPEPDQETLALWRQGLPQTAIGTQLGVSQPSVSTRLQKAQTRLRALHAVEGLPEDREAVREAVLASWDRGPSIMSESTVAEFFVEYTRVWSGARAARSVGVTQSTGRNWTQQLIKLDRKKLPDGIDEGVRQLVEVVEKLRAFHRLPGSITR